MFHCAAKLRARSLISTSAVPLLTFAKRCSISSVGGSRVVMREPYLRRCRSQHCIFELGNRSSRTGLPSRKLFLLRKKSYESISRQSGSMIMELYIRVATKYQFHAARIRHLRQRGQLVRRWYRGQRCVCGHRYARVGSTLPKGFDVVYKESNEGDVVVNFGLALPASSTF